MPFNLGFGEVLIILVVVLLLFGAKRIPEIAGSLGKGINQFKRSINEVDQSIRNPGSPEPEPRRDYERRPDALAAGDVAPTARPAEDADRPEPKRLLS
jgi:sec-independent protein translocase protein TatA